MRSTGSRRRGRPAHERGHSAGRQAARARGPLARSVQQVRRTDRDASGAARHRDRGPVQSGDGEGPLPHPRHLQRARDHPARHLQLHGDDLRRGCYRGRSAGAGRVRRRHHRQPGAQRHLSGPPRMRGRVARILRHGPRHGVLDRLSGQSRDHLDHRRQGRLRGPRHRQPRQHLGRLRHGQCRGRAVQAQ